MQRLVLAVAGVLLLGPRAAAQKPTDIVHWTVSPATVSVTQQGTAKVTLAADIEEGWHLYAISQPPDGPPPLSIAIDASQPFELRARDIDAPPPLIAEDPNLKTEVHYWEKHVAIAVPIVPRKSARAGAHRLPIDVTFQVCSSRMCLRPFTQTLTVNATIRSGSSKGTPR